MKRKIFTAIMAFVMLMTSVQVFALTDAKILSDPVKNTYEGREEAPTIIKNVSFRDLNNAEWAKEAVTRMSSFGLVKGTGTGYFSPNAKVTNEEALAFVLRIRGLEESARAAGERLKDQMPEDFPTKNLWALGYFSEAQRLGLITNEEFDDAQVEDTKTLDPKYSFVRDKSVNREDLARWLGMTLNQMDKTKFPIPTNYTRLYAFNDWNQGDIRNLPYIEACLSFGLMNGVSGNSFNPKGSVTRAQMAQILKNTQDVYYSLKGMERKTGTVGAVQIDVEKTTGKTTGKNSLFIRVSDGSVDVISYQVTSDKLPALAVKDAVVYNNGAILGLSSLKEGDQIEYIVEGIPPENPDTQAQNQTQEQAQPQTPPDPNAPKKVYYVQLTSAYKETTAVGRLYEVNTEQNYITIKNNENRLTHYMLAQGLLDTTKSTLIVDNKEQPIKDLNIGSQFELRLANDIVKSISFVGQPIVENEIRGIVIENDPNLGIITVMSNNGEKVTKSYFEGQLLVKKRQSYTTQDDIGYIDQVFPNFKFNPMETPISDIEPGDIVFMRVDPNDESTISAISAATNYTMRYGKVKSIDMETEIPSMLVEYENKQTDWIDFTPGIFVSTDGKPGSMHDIMPGDWVKVLVNSATIEPGQVLEVAKEVAIEGNEHFISSIVKGQIGNIDPIQKKASLQNYQKLTKEGWSDYNEVMRLDISGNDMEIYVDGKRVSFDFVQNYFKRGGAEAYVAMENFYGGERTKKLTLRTQRDQLLEPDVVMSSFGNGSFMLSGGLQEITSDEGTIVRRHGRLVDPSSIMTPDYAYVSLNGENRAAVVDINTAPDELASGIVLMQGLIQSVDAGKSFTVRSISVLTGTKWFATPVQRVFAIDYNTKFYDESGFMDRDAFIGYGSDAVTHNVYTIVSDGTRADYVVSQPYPKNAVRGTIYESEGDSVSINNLSLYDSKLGKWNSQGAKPVATIAILENSIVIKNNKVVTGKDLEKGDQIRVMTNNIPSKITDTADIEGYIIFVEK